MEDFSAYPLLSRVQSPDAVKALPEKELPALADEIRRYLSCRVRENGGHLSSNLGVVELTIAIHRIFHSPTDHVIFDVGHQSYVHKLLTGRGQELDSLRQPGGICGFTCKEESEHDPFGAGHSSTAVSAALGLAEADRLAGRDCYTVAVIGDGAMSGGLSFEGLNNCPPDRKLILILNENEMSISQSTGRLANHLLRLRGSRRYLRAKTFTGGALTHIPLLGKPTYRILKRIKRRVHHVFYKENLFEHLGIKYLGPVDGNDLPTMLACLSYAKKQGKSILLHVKTVKGKGDAAAELEPGKFHGLPPKNLPIPPVTFSKTFGEALTALAEKNKKIVAITAAMKDGTGLSDFAEKYPERFFDVGIAEGHALTFAAGLAAGGLHPVAALYSTFFQRGYDNLLHDAALQHLSLTLCLDRAGLSEGDGRTHHGIYDLALLASVPNLKIFMPPTPEAIPAALREAINYEGISVLRYPAGDAQDFVKEAFPPCACPELRVFDTAPEPQITLLSYGEELPHVLTAAKRLAVAGTPVRVLCAEEISSYETLAANVAEKTAGNRLLIAEQGVASGFSANLTANLAAAGKLPQRYRVLAVNDGSKFPRKGQTYKELFGLDAEAVFAAAKELL